MSTKEAKSTGEVARLIRKTTFFVRFEHNELPFQSREFPTYNGAAGCAQLVRQTKPNAKNISIFRNKQVAAAIRENIEEEEDK